MPRTDLVLQKADGNNGYKTSEEGEQGLLLGGMGAIAEISALGGHERTACLRAKLTPLMVLGEFVTVEERLPLGSRPS
jgi:hypothetical protein